MAVFSSLAFSLLFTLGVVYLFERSRRRRNERPLPPGPKGLPIFGNVNDMPKPGVLECHHWLEHKDRYGPISSVTVLGQTFVIINDSQIAFELLRDRSAIHSSRPGMVFSCDMIGWRHAMAMCPYDDFWKTQRKNVTKISSTVTSVTVFEHVQEAESVHFLLNVLDAPERLFDHIRKEAGSVILKITYGYNTVPRDSDPFVDLATKTMVDFADATTPGRWMVDILPFLRYLPEWMPGTGFKATARRMATTLAQCTNQPYQFVKQQMQEGRHKPSFLSQCIEDIGSDTEKEFVHKWAALAMYLGGADTTVSAMMTFFLAMTIFPEVQKKAQEELDRVVGPNRLPVTTDKPSLPYINACMLETHRWHQVLPMGLPHLSTEEDTIRGYRIPKGSILLSNNWAFTHDPALYPDPMTFRPERFLTTATHAAETDPRSFIFGYGRRICPGRFVADNALFITIAQSLAVFDVRKVVEGGREVQPRVEFEPGAISHPLPFRCDVRPRSGRCERLIREAERDYPWEKSDVKELEGVEW